MTSKSLKPFNTFAVDAQANHWVEPASLEELLQVLEEIQLNNREDVLILGGGSNVLLVRENIDMVVKMAIQGIEVLEDDGRHVWVRAGAGVVWNDLVQWSLAKELPGLENLSLIPGSVGAAPMQNIGAYGVEFQNIFYELEAVERETGKMKSFNKENCQFGYRTSVFKTSAKGRYVISHVTLKLDREAPLMLEYVSLKTELQKMNMDNITIRDVSQVVTQIRQSKLPDPQMLGNGGSFFKNPTVEGDRHRELLKEHPDLVSYAQLDGSHKLAAGWLIEKAGWKGRRKGDCGVHAKQALVLVNHGGASGGEIAQLAREVQEDVLGRFGVKLEPEVNIIY